MKPIQRVFGLVMLLLGLICCRNVSAKIIETTNITEVLTSVDTSGPTLVLFDVDDTLMDSETTLNSGKWIQFYWKTAPKLVSDNEPLIECLMWFVTRRVPVKPVESLTPQLIQELQSRQGVVVSALTARPFTSGLENEESRENLTAQQLCSVGIDFSRSVIPMDLASHPSVHDGIVFSSGKAKGGHLQEILKHAEYRPCKIIFVDDKLEQVQSVDRAMQEAGIACDCFWYRRADKEHAVFNPLIALIQLDYLLVHQQLLSDHEAENLEEDYAGIKLELLLHQLLEQYEGQCCVDKNTS